MQSKQENKGGVVASSINFNRHSGNVVHVIYMDLVLFRNSNSKIYEKPNIRETVGWILAENDEEIQIIWDQSLKQLPNEEIFPEDSGLTIPRHAILRIKSLIRRSSYRYSTEKSKK